MSRNGSGTYTLPANTVSPAVAGDIISPDDFNSVLDDLETELTDSLSRSNKGAMLAPLTLMIYTVAALPAGAAGYVAFASNGRKNGEGVGSGTGVVVFHDGTAWRACDTGATVAA